jgi:hypothetical protein
MGAALTEDVKARIKRAMNDLENISSASLSDSRQLEDDRV